MPIGLSPTTKLFHGTSRQRFDSIVKNGFQLGSIHYDQFLSATGIYFVANRPLIARRFALMAATEEQCEEIVVSVELKPLANDALLDLTTDKGSHILYKGYLRLIQLFKQKRREATPRTPTVYEASLENYVSSFELFGKELLMRMSEHKKPLNWDSPALKCIASENNSAVIVAAIQEGTTFNEIFIHEKYTHGTSKNYHGISCRDHLEICVIDPSLIDMKSLQVRLEQEDLHYYKDGFGYEILNFIRPDVN